MRCVMLLLLSAAAVGCQQQAGNYEISAAGDRVFLLNKANGAASVIDGVELHPVRAASAPTDVGALATAKAWPEQSIQPLDGAKILIRTKYRDGRMQYVVAAAPFSGAVERQWTLAAEPSHRPTLMIDFFDNDGFRIGESIELDIRRGNTREVDEKGAPQSLVWTGFKNMASESYASASVVSLRWTGF